MEAAVSRLRKSLIIIVVVLAAIQFVPVDRSNPPVQGVVGAPQEVLSVLERSCFDCHSNKTRWPWYSHVAPVSWLVAHDVHEGRSHMNFTEWNTLPVHDQAELIENCWKMVNKGDMPLWYYLPMHPDARLSDADKALIQDWAQVAGADGDDEHDDHD